MQSFFKGRSVQRQIFNSIRETRVQMRRSFKHPCKYKLWGFFDSLICVWKAFNCTYQYCTRAHVYVFVYMCVMSWCTASNLLISIQPTRARTHKLLKIAISKHSCKCIISHVCTHAHTHTRTHSQPTHTHSLLMRPLHTAQLHYTHLCTCTHAHTTYIAFHSISHVSREAPNQAVILNQLIIYARGEIASPRLTS